MADRLDTILGQLFRGVIRPDQARRSIEELYPQARKEARPPTSTRPPLLARKHETGR